MGATIIGICALLWGVSARKEHREHMPDVSFLPITSPRQYLCPTLPQSALSGWNGAEKIWLYAARPILPFPLLESTDY